MSTVKQVVGSKSALTGISATLASATYGVTTVKDNTTNQPLDNLVEVAITPGTTTGNKQAVIFAKASIDNSVFSSGPESGTTATDEGDLFLVGVLPLNTAAGAQVKQFPIAAAFGGVLPPFYKIIIKNDSGAAFSAVSVNAAEVSSTVA
jgi:hypothetical protein